MTSFAVILTRGLKKRGLRGDWVLARVEDEAFTLTGAESGAVSIPYGEIHRIRVGFTEGKGGVYYECSLCAAIAGRLTLHRHNAYPAGYRDGVLALAGHVARHRGIGAVERGTSKFDALLGPGLVLVPLLGAIYIAAIILDDEPWWGRLIVPTAPAVVFALLLWRAVARHLPRPVADLEELAAQLPPG